jgi:glycolate oxidase
LEARIKQSLRKIVGEENVSDSFMDLVVYSYDASDHDHRPMGAVWPTSTEQVSEVVKLANEHGFPVIPRGAGTGLAGGAVPVLGGLVVDLSRMNRILEIRITDRLAIVEPGVVYMDLQNTLAPYGFFFPPDPASGKACTLGGNVATNAGGLRAAKYGVTRDYVMGLKVVLPDGRIMKTGSHCMKTSSGYDLARLFVGSEGTLGVVTEIALKISPKPTEVKTCLAFFPRLHDAGQAVADITGSGAAPSILELMDANSIRVVRARTSLDIPEADAMLLVETDGFTEKEPAFQMDKAIKAMEKNHAFNIRYAKSAKEAEDLWSIRKAVAILASGARPNSVSGDVTVPVSRVPELVDGIEEIITRYGLPYVVFGHAGDGNMHPKIMYDRNIPEEARGIEKAWEEIFVLTTNLDGTISGEHGIGIAKAPYMYLEHDEVERDVMRIVKHALDPRNLMNPGKIDVEKS